MSPDRFGRDIPRPTGVWRPPRWDESPGSGDTPETSPLRYVRETLECLELTAV